MKMMLMISLAALMLLAGSCALSMQKSADYPVTLMTVDPGHFHAALVQKEMYPQLNPTVYVYAPAGPDVEGHLARINQFNTRPENPTQWNTKVYRGDDFLQKAMAERKGNVVMLSGNNRKKTEYIKTFVDAGVHVYSDKPMCIDKDGFALLKEAFVAAEQNNVLLYDIMTERYLIHAILQRTLAQDPDVFGTLQTGTAENPAIVKESVHHFYKNVAGQPLIRPDWFFDTIQQGEGIVDVTTHLVDQVQWKAFPDQIIDYTKDIQMLSARRWPTMLTREQFDRVTGMSGFPAFLQTQLNADGALPCYANGQIDYRINGVHARVKVQWDYQAPEGAEDTHFSLMRGTLSDIVILQGADQKYKHELYVKPANSADMDKIGSALYKAILELQREYRGVMMLRDGDRWHVSIPDRYRIGHEAHFAKVTEKYLRFLEEGKMPEWEVPNMITKYYITTTALEMAK